MISWQNIYGHEQIKADLQLLLQENKLPHALLFSGIDGIGKLLTAKMLAKSLLCCNSQQGNMDKITLIFIIWSQKVKQEN